MNGEMSAISTKRTFVFALRMSAIGGKADMPFCTFGSDECPLSTYPPTETREIARVSLLKVSSEISF